MIDKKVIFEKTVDYIDSLPDGANTTTARVLHKLFPEDADERGALRSLRNIDLVTMHFEIEEAVEARGNVTLDFSSHDGKLEGLPFNLDFYVRRKQK